MRIQETIVSVSLAALLLAGCGQSDEATTAAEAVEEQAVVAEISEEVGEEVIAEPAGPSEGDLLNAFFAEEYEAEQMRRPESLTRNGRRERYGEWNTRTDDATIENAIRAQASLDRLHEFDYDALSDADQVSYQIYEFGMESRIEAANFFRQAYPVTQMYSFPAQSQLLLVAYHTVENVADAEAYISRLRNYETAMGEIAALIRDRTEYGVLPPSFTYPMVLTVVEDAISGAPFDDGAPSTLLADFTEKAEALDVSDEEKARLIDEASAAMVGPMRAGFEDVATALNEAIPLATTDDGVWRLPMGEAYYAERVRFRTQTDMTPDEIHDWGLSEVARVQDQMREIMVQVGYEGTLQEFFVFMQTNPDNFYPDNDEGREAFMTEARRMGDELMARTPEFFNLLPQAPLEVRRVEAFREEMGTIAHYNRPPPDGSSPGIYYANLRTMELWPRHIMEAITYHEGVPGHHFQIALMQELQGLPEFRTQGMFTNTAFVEGWGLYSEQVAKEMGFYTDPYSDFGRLATDIWRAVRLVVDTGMHHKRWTRSEAYDYMLANSALSAGVVEAEINRYIIWPGQSLAYRVGKQRILDLRAHAQEELGEEFDIRFFHDAVLGSGAVPLPVLEANVQRYIDAELAN